jgi:broad specificity phosphatase PhoE
MKKEIYLIRHGRTLYNLQKRVQGRGIDSSLDPLGIAQGQAFYEHYQQQPFELIFTSSLKRTKETVSPFIQEGITHIEMPELDEISWGIYEGKESNEEMHAEYKRVRSSWAAGNYHARIEEGESAKEMVDRLHLFVNQLKKRAEEKILVCTHGGSMAFLMTILQEQPISEMVQYRHRNTGLCHFHFDGSNFQLKLQDDIKHLEIRDIDPH